MNIDDDDNLLPKTPPNGRLLVQAVTPPVSPRDPEPIPMVVDGVLLVDSQHGGLEGGHIDPIPLSESQFDHHEELPHIAGFENQNVPANIHAVNWHQELLNTEVWNL